MSGYDYSCAVCGTFEVVRPLGTAAAEEACPSCGDRARRVYGAPSLGVRTRLSRLTDAAERSAHEPEVRRAVAPPTRRPAANPLHARLPRQ